MAHRIYLYNYDQKTNQSFNTHLGEWNYEIPLLLYPLIAENSKVEGVEFISDKEQGIVQLRYFFNLLADTYQLHYKKAYYEPVNTMFEFLEALPYDSFVLNATDVFNMNEEKHKVQAKEWLVEIQQKRKLYKKAVETQNLSLLDSLFSHTGYSSFLEILQTDWINYGLGYFEELAYKKVASSIFEKDGKFGLKDAKGVVLAPPVYDEIFEADYHHNISVIQKEGLFGYLQSDGKELIPPVYEEAFDVFDFALEPFGEVKVNGKSGILKIYSNTWLVPADYDAVERLAYGFLGVEIAGRFGVYSDENGLIIPVESENTYEYDYFPELFFSRQKGTGKRRYYTKEGNYLGDFVEGSLLKTSTCFWVKPNKFNKKGKLIDENGNTIIDEADQLIVIDNFDTLAVRKDKSWKLYDTSKHQFLLENERITKVKAISNVGYKSNVFTLETQNGSGLFDAEHDIWLIAPQFEIKQIHYLENGFLSVQKNNGYQLYDFEKGLSAEKYEYISNPLNYRTEEGLLFLYKGESMLRMNEDKSIQQVETSGYGTIYLDRYSFRGKDLEHFISFYNRWKNQAGSNSEQFLETEVIKKLAFDAKENQNYQEALRLFQLSAQKNNVDSWVELGILHTDPDIEMLFDPQKGIMYYEKAAQYNHPVAWNNIGTLYHNGIGYSFNIKKAIQAYEKGAELGDGMALTNLGDLYYFGEHVLQDYDKALAFYQKAEKKYYYNYDKISEIYYQLRDYKNLLEYLKKDYDQSYSGIYYGIIYEHGMGVKIDLKKAVKYYEQANAYNAYEYATQRLLYYYGNDSTFKNEKKFQKWKSFAEENGFETN
ncbi:MULTISPECIES: tetratricopeptide repeat protein [unclassified Chryseobacterium]|uniref:tetratricopeptide repeat protein n=1 Tax=unclassified Chryseobacterium TaxID=2593645 RepID=UPI002853531D|nr:tetratricopeptide repeat protein [Chryseobacterium sp. CFS7]MDR4892096.1 tetratricopeptide repeat protein [Chryseobacterium sp. CFS7]